MAEGLSTLPEFVGGQGLMAGVQGGLHEGDKGGGGMGGMAWKDSSFFPFEGINKKGRERN